MFYGHTIYVGCGRGNGATRNENFATHFVASGRCEGAQPINHFVDEVEGRCFHDFRSDKVSHGTTFLYVSQHIFFKIVFSIITTWESIHKYAAMVRRNICSNKFLAAKNELLWHIWQQKQKMLVQKSRSRTDFFDERSSSTCWVWPPPVVTYANAATYGHRKTIVQNEGFCLCCPRTGTILYDFKLTWSRHDRYS